MESIGELTNLPPEGQKQELDNLPFFPVSLLKLTVMSFATLNLYQFYWFYKNWSYIKRHSNLKISPLLRTIFQPLFFIQLFTLVYKHKYSDQKSISSAVILAILSIASNLMYFFPPPYYAFAYLAIFYILPIQATINFINRSVSDSYDYNNKFSIWNWVAIVLGIPLYVLIIIDLIWPFAISFLLTYF